MRLTNAFSKKLANLKASVAFHYAHYNFVRVHRTLRCTPAMAAGVTDRLWSVEELIHHRNQWLMGQAMSGRKKRPEKHQRDTQTGQSKTQPHHPVGSINPCQHSDRHTQKRKDDQSMPDSLANKIIAGGTILLGIVGIGSLWLTYCSIRQTADAVAAAKAAANAAQAANELTLENISPHIYQTGFSLQPLKIGESSTVKVTLRNTGNEPAENYGIGGVVEIRPDRPINVNLASGALGEFPPSVTRVTSFAAKSALTMEQLNGIKNGTLTLYFYGAYRYTSPRAGRPDIVVGFCSRHTAQTIENGMDACGGYPPDVLLNGFPLQRTPKVQGAPRKYLGQD